MEHIPQRRPGENWTPKVTDKPRSDLFGFVLDTFPYGIQGNIDQY